MAPPLDASAFSYAPRRSSTAERLRVPVRSPTSRPSARASPCPRPLLRARDTHSGALGRCAGHHGEELLADAKRQEQHAGRLANLPLLGGGPHSARATRRLSPGRTDPGGRGRRPEQVEALLRGPGGSANMSVRVERRSERRPSRRGTAMQACRFGARTPSRASAQPKVQKTRGRPGGTRTASCLFTRRQTMKKSTSKLTLSKQTIRVLAGHDLAPVAGGWIRPPISWSCPQAPVSK